MSGVPALDSTMGATYIGVVLSAALWGVTTLQTWYYYREYPEDPFHFKALVGVVFVLDTLHQIFISHTVYLYLITNYFNPLYLNQTTWSILAEVLVAGIVALLVQSFFITRIWTLSNKNIFLVTGVGLLVAAQFVCTLVYCGKAFQMTTYAEIATIKAWSMSMNGTTAASDIAIAITLCGLLHTSRTGFRRSDTLINKMILFTVNTGLLTSIDALCSLITIAALPNAFVYICFFFALGRLYANSLLATLNARSHLKKSAEETTSISLSGMSGGRVQNSSVVNAVSVPLVQHTQPNNSMVKITPVDGGSDMDIPRDRKRSDGAFA